LKEDRELQLEKDKLEDLRVEAKKKESEEQDKINQKLLQE
jgi:hypothetical protein